MRPRTLGMLGQGHKIAGELNGMARLTAARVRWARAGKRLGLALSGIAGVFGVCPSTLQKAVRRSTWARVR